jgi:hypothetical protein
VYLSVSLGFITYTDINILSDSAIKHKFVIKFIMSSLSNEISQWSHIVCPKVRTNSSVLNIIKLFYFIGFIRIGIFAGERKILQKLLFEDEKYS